MKCDSVNYLLITTMTQRRGFGQLISPCVASKLCLTRLFSWYKINGSGFLTSADQFLKLKRCPFRTGNYHLHWDQGGSPYPDVMKRPAWWNLAKVLRLFRLLIIQPQFDTMIWLYLGVSRPFLKEVVLVWRKDTLRGATMFAGIRW